MCEPALSVSPNAEGVFYSAGEEQEELRDDRHVRGEEQKHFGFSSWLFVHFTVGSKHLTDKSNNFVAVFISYIISLSLLYLSKIL